MSTGAGSNNAGTSLSGSDTIVVAASNHKVPVVAMRYEGSIRDWELDEEKNFVWVTPNEQGVALSMSIRQGSVKSSLTTGNTLHEILYLGQDNIGADVTNRVMLSNPIARLVANNNVSIDKIVYQTSKRGLKVAVYFRDLDVDPNTLKPIYWRSQ